MTLEQRLENLEQDISLTDNIIFYLLLENQQLYKRLKDLEDKQEEQSNSIEDLEMTTEEIKREVDYLIE